MRKLTFDARRRWLAAGIVLAAWLAAVGALTACSDQPYDPDAPAIDPEAPRVHITSPAMGGFAGDVAMLRVEGTVADDGQIVSLEVNGVTAAIAGGTWSAMVPVAPGTQLLHAVARDRDGNLGKESRAVVVGALQPIATTVPSAITAAISAQAFDALGRGATGLLRDGKLLSVVSPFNPVIAVGGGPDCLYAQASITRADLGDVSTSPAGPGEAALPNGSAVRSSVSITPVPGGLAIDLALDQLAVAMHVDYAVACVPLTADIGLAASHVKLTAVLRATAQSGKMDIVLASPTVEITGLQLDIGAIPTKIADLLHIKTALGPLVELAGEKLLVPLLNRALGGLGNAVTVDVLGTPVDLQVTPTRIGFDPSGAVLELDTQLRAHGDDRAPGYVYLPHEAPVLGTDAGFELAIADDAVNQLLASYWAAGGMNRTLDLKTGSYGQLGVLYDRVELATKVPPFVDASGSSLTLVVGDFVASFLRGDTVTTRIAVSARIAVTLALVDGAPRLDVGAPTTFVDVLDEQVYGANTLSNAQFEAITSFALGRVIAVGSGTIGALPVPAFGGVALRDVGMSEQVGYVVVDGKVQ